jgi:hypothetical protein
MGCDIHFYVEQRFINDEDKEDKKGIWVSIDRWCINFFSIMYREESIPRWDVEFTEQYYWKRNYFLFSILAGVRNHYNVVPIAKPRGLPDDVTLEIKELSISEGVDAHSHSWLTLKELVEFNWDRRFDYVHHYKTYKGLNKIRHFIKFLYYKIKPLTYREACKEFHADVIDRLSKLGNNEDLRIVFWFDN